ncbi:MAG: beta-lactamase family protein [Clostridia bacterium]|nr:beta-lactamase family protein [Clostridia bacterium]
MSYELSSSVIKQIEKFCKNKPNITLTVGILDGNEENYLSFTDGGSQLERDTSDKAYEIGSITKVFTAVLMAKLIRDGKAELTTSIAPYIGVKNTQYYYPTLERLASHTSGLGDAPLSAIKLIGQVVSGVGRKKNIYSGINGKKLEKKLRELNLAPTSYPTKYSHYGIATLGYVLGKIDGRGYKAAIEELCSKDLGLENTVYGLPSTECGHTATGSEFPGWVWTEKDALAPSDCLASTARDMIKFARANLSDEFDWMKICHEVRSEYDDYDNFGFGFIIRADNGVLWHNGSTGVYSSFLGIDRATGKAIVLLSDYEHKTGESGVDRIGFEFLCPKPVKAEDDEYEEGDEYEDEEDSTEDNE